MTTALASSDARRKRRAAKRVAQHPWLGIFTIELQANIVNVRFSRCLPANFAK